MKRDTLTDLEDIGNSIGNLFKDMVGLETNNNIIDDIKNIDVSNKETNALINLWLMFRRKNIA